jgi:ATP-dependent Clp protease ATP-binding subunit ClpC
MDALDIAPDKIGESAQRVMDRAVEESRRREHAIVANEHLFLALAQVEWDTFSHVMQDLEVNPHVIVDALEEHLQLLPTLPALELRLAPTTKTVFDLAFLRASGAGRTIASSDLFSALLEESHGVPVSIIRSHGVSPDMFVSRITTHMDDNEGREELLRKRLELPETLKSVATNLNLLARLNKIPPVYGRDKEIQQVLEILCHRERSNSVMLIGEPGVGKTAIVEDLARRLEFEPWSVPMRLRDCQVVNLQMNSHALSDRVGRERHGGVFSRNAARVCSIHKRPRQLRAGRLLRERPLITPAHSQRHTRALRSPVVQIPAAR